MDADDDNDSDGIIVHPDDPVPWFPEQSPTEKPNRLKRRRRCGECGPCQVKTNCGECAYCLRRSVLKQSCIYRKCIYLRKPVNKRSPSKEDRRPHKRQKVSSVSHSYPPELMIPDSEGQYPYELLSPSEQDAYLDEFLSPPSDGGHRPFFLSSPEENDSPTEVSVTQHGGVAFPEFVPRRSMVIDQPNLDESNNADESETSPIAEQELSSEATVEQLPDATIYSRILRTPPHPRDREEEEDSFVNPQMMKALKTVEECGHKFIQNSKQTTEKSQKASTNVVDKSISPALSSTKSVDKNTVASPSPSESHKTPHSKELGPTLHDSPAIQSLESFITHSPTSLIYSNPTQSINASYCSRNPFVSPPNVTVGRSGGFTQNHAPGNKSNLWPDRCGSSLPLNLSRGPGKHPLDPRNSHNGSPMAELPKFPPASYPWGLGMSPYSMSHLSRMHMPPGAMPPGAIPPGAIPPGAMPSPYHMTGLEYPYPAPHPAFHPFPHPYAPPRMPGFGSYPTTGSLFPADSYPYPTGMYSSGGYPPMPGMRHPHEHMIYQSHQPEDYARSAYPLKQTSSPASAEAEREEIEKYKQFSIFRLQNKTPSEECDKQEAKNSKETYAPNDITKTVPKPPACTNETLRKLLNKTAVNRNNNNSNSNNKNDDDKTHQDGSSEHSESDASIGRQDSLNQQLDNNRTIQIDLSKISQKDVSRSDIDEDLRKEMHKVSGYCGCNFITIDDLKMQALIRSDGVNNLEIEIPSPDHSLKDPIVHRKDTCNITKSKTPSIVEKTRSSTDSDPNALATPVPLKGMISLRQDLGEEGVLILEVNSDKVKLVQCELSDELLNEFENPKELKEFILKAQKSGEKDKDRSTTKLENYNRNFRTAEKSIPNDVSKGQNCSEESRKGGVMCSNANVMSVPKPPALQMGFLHSSTPMPRLFSSLDTCIQSCPILQDSRVLQLQKPNDSVVMSRDYSLGNGKLSDIEARNVHLKSRASVDKRTEDTELQGKCSSLSGIVSPLSNFNNHKTSAANSRVLNNQSQVSAFSSGDKSTFESGLVAADKTTFESRNVDCRDRSEQTVNVSDCSDESMPVDLTSEPNCDESEDLEKVGSETNIEENAEDSICIESMEEEEEWGDEESSKIIIEDHDKESSDDSYRIEINEEFETEREPPITIVDLCDPSPSEDISDSVTELSTNDDNSTLSLKILSTCSLTSDSIIGPIVTSNSNLSGSRGSSIHDTTV